MIRDMAGAPGLTVIWPPEGTSTSAPSYVGIARRLDMAQARLDAVEAHRAGRDPHTPPAAQHERELRAIRRLVADLTTDLLGADHPLVTQLVSCERPHGEVAPAACIPSSRLDGVRVHCFVHRVSFVPR